VVRRATDEVESWGCATAGDELRGRLVVVRGRDGWLKSFQHHRSSRPAWVGQCGHTIVGRSNAPTGAGVMEPLDPPTATNVPPWAATAHPCRIFSSGGPSEPHNRLHHKRIAFLMAPSHLWAACVLSSLWLAQPPRRSSKLPRWSNQSATWCGSTPSSKASNKLECSDGSKG
jgi:hypothetical protein